ncbi:plasmalemma vesicle-associated protein [Hyperolius riggenbachi]|uniref:plasmalemma vesicle-associated protein n=1 Tax=Hyperolius riggenbachi TaxID=752182 RepID=UPI0035A2F8CF
MDPSYAMAKFGLESKDILRSKQKGCWHYMKYVFIFSSIIQFLIILGLVLFMLYGNAHGGTESRLQSVESRFKALTYENMLLLGNFSQLKTRHSGLEKQMQNCTNIVMAKNKQIENMTMTRIIFGQRTPQSPQDPCKFYTMTLDHMNITCTNDKLKLQTRILQLELEFSKYKETNSKTVGELSTKGSQAIDENETLRKTKTNLENQLKLAMDTCTDVDMLFKQEIQRMKASIDTTPYNAYSSLRCITDATINNMQLTVDRLRQNVNNIVFENSQLKASQAGMSEDLRKCTQDKDAALAEKSKIAVQKEDLEKKEAQAIIEFSKLTSRYMKKEEDLENCRKIQARPVYTGYQG